MMKLKYCPYCDKKTACYREKSGKIHCKTLGSLGKEVVNRWGRKEEINGQPNRKYR